MNKQTMDRNELNRQLETQLQNWEQGISQLEANANELSGEPQARFESLVTTMRQKLQQVRDSLRTIDGSDANALQKFKAQFNRLETELRQTFAQAKAMAGNSLGWPEGLANIREPNSEGWAEGFGEQPKNSKGWAEGMAESREHDSRGWAEGFEKEKSN